MKKRTAAILAVLVGLLVLVSCNQDKGSGSPSEKPNQKDYGFDTWSESDALYSIVYKNGSFSSDYSNVVFLEKAKDQPFIILNLTDIQISNVDLSSANSQVVFLKKTLDYLVLKYKPNLITYTGDFGDYGANMASLVYISNIIDSYDIPWAPVFGNHDNESALNREKAWILQENYDNCLFKAGPENLAKIENLTGKTNNPAMGHYIVNIVESDGTLVNSLIFMNTGNYRTFSSSEIATEHEGETKYDIELSNWGSLNKKQIAWYEWAVKSAQNYNPDVKSSLFIHIPVFEYAKAVAAAIVGTRSYLNKADLYNVAKNITFEQSKLSEKWNEGYKSSVGVMHESTVIGCSVYDDFVFKKIKELGSTDFVICGHDHKNNFAIEYQGVKLVYGTKLGAGCYWENGLSGGTVITVTADSTSVEQVVYMPQ